ncbi:MAG: DUF4097 family beta strand repeat-containing protein [Bacteroidota bacterium]
MKYTTAYFYLFLFALSPFFAKAQEKIIDTYNVPLSKPNQSGALYVDLHNGTINVQGYNGKEVVVNFVERSKSNDWDWGDSGSHSSKNSKKGLKKISSSYVNLEIEEDNNSVYVKGSHNRRSDLLIKVPQNFALQLKTHHNGDIKVSNVNGEQVITTHHGGIEMEKIGGSVVADTHHGAIRVGFTSITPNVPMAFSTYHGDVDIIFPSSVNCSTKIKTAKGDIYTDFDLELKSVTEDNVSSTGRRKIKIGGWMYGELGKGGEEFLFNTHHGDVVIRKL